MSKRTWIAFLTITGVLALLVASLGGRAQAAGEPDWDGDGAIAADCRKLDPAVHPGATDLPDVAFEDMNCDGIDGEAGDAVFVAPGGDDDNVGSPAQPYKTMQRAVDEAISSGKLTVYAAVGGYSRVLLGTNADGLRIYGGYQAGSWDRTTSPASTVSGSPEAMVLDGASDVALQLLTLNGTRGGEKTAYGIRATGGSEVALIKTRATAGEGGAGADGNVGSTPAKAATGDAGESGPADCNVAGAGGNIAQFGNGTDGGDGGAGGEETNDGENGAPGIKGDGTGGGVPGAGGVDIAGDAHGPNDGMHGQVGGTGGSGTGGSQGPGGANDFGLAAATWAGRNGSAGGPGGIGYGGGGGGGGAGRGGTFDWGAGAGGGQGGDGGAGGGGGTRGEWGGGSFGVYLHNSQAAVVDGSALQSAPGGRGGNGGTGGAGGAGGNGGLGAAARTHCGITLGNGGNGGAGGQGGQGGNGGGGSGGPSVALMRLGTSLATTRSSTLAHADGGAAGAHGSAGQGQSGTVLPDPSPATDFDGDGITDASDACVDVARGTDGDGDGCPDRAAALPDADGDGVPNDGRDKCPSAKAVTDANFDGCTDVTVTPTATATATATSTVTPPPPPPPPVVVNATLSSSYKAFKTFTRYTRLTLKRVPRGAAVTVTCKGKKCPARRFTSKRSGSVKLGRFVNKKLRPGTTLTIRVTKAGAIGKQFVIKIRKGARPKLTIRQLT